MASAVVVRNLSYSYGSRAALVDLSLEIAAGEAFGVLGPNGGGKSTLFRLLSTLLVPQRGEATVLGLDLRSQVHEIRSRIGIVFQSASLDKKLSVSENLRYHAALYGIFGKEAALREAELLELLGLADRAGELCERLSGGLRRRVEIAKGMISRPELLLLDEPSTGLDPAARIELRNALERLRSERGVTILLTTHILEEAAEFDRVAILDQGRLVALDSPETLQAEVGGDVITIRTRDSERALHVLAEKFQWRPTVTNDEVRLEIAEGRLWIARIVEALPGAIEEITLAKPTLEDVFLAKTGKRFHQEEAIS